MDLIRTKRWEVALQEDHTGVSVVLTWYVCYVGSILPFFLDLHREVHVLVQLKKVGIRTWGGVC